MTTKLVHLTTTDMSLDWLLRPQLEAFIDAGFEVVAMSAPGPHVDALRASGIEHYPIGSLTRSMSPLRDARAVMELVRAFRDISPDIVHTHNPKPGVFGRIAAKVAGVPAIVNTVHGLYALPEDRLPKRAVVYGLERLAASCSDAELLQNVEDLRVLRRLGISHSKLSVLGNGVDLRRFSPHQTGPQARTEIRAELGVEDDTVVIGVVGRLVWEKGYEAVFDAAERLADENCVFVVVGPSEPDKDGAVDADAIDRAKAWGVRFLGARNDMVDIYSAFDVYTLASHREGFPRSAMEASAMGLPIVATDIRGCRQVVAPGVTGQLVAPRDGAALAQALAVLVGDAGRRQSQGAAARERALERFDDREVIARTLRTYECLLAREPAAAMAAS